LSYSTLYVNRSIGVHYAMHDTCQAGQPSCRQGRQAGRQPSCRQGRQAGRQATELQGNRAAVAGQAGQPSCRAGRQATELQGRGNRAAGRQAGNRAAVAGKARQGKATEQISARSTDTDRALHAPGLRAAGRRHNRGLSASIGGFP
jgi:hypothetical protein